MYGEYANNQSNDCMTLNMRGWEGVCMVSMQTTTPSDRTAD